MLEVAASAFACLGLRQQRWLVLDCHFVLYTLAPGSTERSIDSLIVFQLIPEPCAPATVQPLAQLTCQPGSCPISSHDLIKLHSCPLLISSRLPLLIFWTSDIVPAKVYKGHIRMEADLILLQNELHRLPDLSSDRRNHTELRRYRASWRESPLQPP
jgi:hypothetical protein